VRLFHRSVPHDELMRVRAGTLDDASWFQPAAEFFAPRRFPWVSIDGEPAQCAERPAPEDHAAILAVWQRLQDTV